MLLLSVLRQNVLSSLWARKSWRLEGKSKRMTDKQDAPPWFNNLEILHSETRSNGGESAAVRSRRPEARGFLPSLLEPGEKQVTGNSS